MLIINRLVLIGLLSVGMTVATTAQAGNQLFEASWKTFSFGNELTGGATGEDSELYSGFGIPAGVQCNKLWPRCPFNSTPTDGGGSFNVLGGTDVPATYCAPWFNWGGLGTAVRPQKGQTPSTPGPNARPIPPLYRNYDFFSAMTPNAQPNRTECNATSTDGFGGQGVVQAGSPLTGTWNATTTAAHKGAFNFAAAPAAEGAAGFRTTALYGDFENIAPYLYSYSYATLRNGTGTFAPGAGPGNFSLTYTMGAVTSASIIVKEGPAKFGGTMELLGNYTTKVCYFRNAGCSLGNQNWRYDAVGASASTSLGVVTAGDLATYKAYYFHTNLMQVSTVNVAGRRFPWTTGSVTLKATGRGPHKTVHYAKGYDNRNTTTSLGKGTIQLVTPVLTRWFQPAVAFETGGVGILRIKFVPEPQTWAILIAGVSLLGVGYRMRGR